MDVGPVFDLAWVGESRVVMSRVIGDGTGSDTADVWTYDVVAESLERVDLPGPPKECRGIAYMRPSRLSDRSVLLYSLCYSPTFDGRLNVGSILSLNLETETLRPLVSANVNFNPSRIDWREGQGLISRSSGLCAGIARLTPEGVEPWDVTVAGRRIDEEVFSEAVSCSEQIRADMPTIGPNGQVAFIASPESVGVDASGRDSIPWLIYVIAESGVPEALPVEIVDPSALRWAPSGQALAFGGKVAGKGDGLWIISWPEGQLTKVSRETVSALDWAPAGDRLAAIVEAGTGAEWPPKVRLLVYRLTDV
ncbi:MAG: hypothetical protein WD770_04550 [Actinomycetota bacterium]